MDWFCVDIFFLGGGMVEKDFIFCEESCVWGVFAGRNVVGICLLVIGVEEIEGREL